MKATLTGSEKKNPYAVSNVIQNGLKYIYTIQEGTDIGVTG